MNEMVRKISELAAKRDPSAPVAAVQPVILCVGVPYIVQQNITQIFINHINEPYSLTKKQ